MSGPTAEVEAIRAAVMARFPDAVNGGISNCRKIAGSSRWSQHAWGNAWDIFGPGRSSGASDQAFLDSVYAYLMRSRGRLPIGTVCWKSNGGCSAAAHQDHIHVEGNPRRSGTPPCAGGGPTDTQRRVVEATSEVALRAVRARQRGRDITSTADAARIAATTLLDLTDPNNWRRAGLFVLGGVTGLIGVTLLSRDLVEQATGLSTADVVAAVATRGASAAT